MGVNDVRGFWEQALPKQESAVSVCRIVGGQRERPETRLPRSLLEATALWTNDELFMTPLVQLAGQSKQLLLATAEIHGSVNVGNPIRGSGQPAFKAACFLVFAFHGALFTRLAQRWHTHR
jgi:hypothetical protein